MSASRTTTARSRLGFTLIELTVVLAVIVTLALIITPSITSFVNDARQARAQSDCQTFASAIVNFYRDNGFFPSWKLAQNGGPGTAQNRLQLLISPGNIPAEDQPSLWSTGIAGQLADQLLTDTPGYSVRTASSANGWNGPYLASVIRADPWGNRYVVNIELIDTSATATTRTGGIKAAVWVLSAGANGILETPFSQSILTAMLVGDDIGTRLQ